MPDEGGVFGNLPRSRPGPRSAKRESAAPDAERPARAAASAAARAERSGSRAADTARAERGPSRQRPAAAGHPPGSRGGDPLGDVVRLAVGTAETGARIASGITRELLRRLPRP